MSDEELLPALLGRSASFREMFRENRAFFHKFTEPRIRARYARAKERKEIARMKGWWLFYPKWTRW